MRALAARFRDRRLLIIGPDGVVLKKFIGPMDEERLEQVLDELLQGAASGIGASGIGNEPRG